VSRSESPPRRNRRTVTRNRRGRSTREAILRAADRLLKRRGFEALSVDAVARAAGVTRSSVYHQFHSRDGLFLHLIAESLRGLQRRGDGRYRYTSSLDRFLHEAEAGFRADPELLRMFYRLIFDRSWSRPELKKLLREAYRFRTGRLAAGLREDGVRGDPEALAIVVAAAFDGLYARSLIDLGPGRLRRAFRTIQALVAAGQPAKTTGQR
jgi:TetR/AcrR family transcriptional regulator, regulator of biofilm formation and stress response